MGASTDPHAARKPLSGQAEGPSIDPADVARFSAQATEWWDPKGPFAPLHRFNPARLEVIRDAAADHFGRDGHQRAAFEGLKLIDIGCGGGLISEPMRRLGFEVTSVDASSENIGTARAHAEMMGLNIAYRAATAEQVLDEGAGRFDVVLALEIVEHVTDPAAFARTCAELVAPGGLLILATLNRTLKSLALGKVAAEYILRWVPAGTHDWTQFLKPEELIAMLKGTGLEVLPAIGLNYEPLADRWSQGSDTSINYMLVATRDRS